ncbi:MAG: hypothetical protein H7Z74_08445 [Anaerolineae bacterium]|nr:hypothetical protein [Gemmatimonadaceae bacterium]
MPGRRKDNSDACGIAQFPVDEDEPEVTITVSTRRNGASPIIQNVNGARGFPRSAGDDSVRIVVRDGEVVITVRTSSTDDGIARPLVRIEPEIGESAPSRRRSRGRALLPVPFVGFTTVAADKMGQGYGNFTLRADLAESYATVHAEVKALGGVLTSSGALRSLKEPATPGRSKTSLHYTGRAIDLFINTGMQGALDRYMVTRSGGTDSNPEWKLYCVAIAPLVNDPLYQAELIEEGELDCAIWEKGTGYATVRRRATYFCLTDLLAAQGWLPIPARKDWKTNYLSCEWWHFQHHTGLVTGRSRFGDELLQVWSAELVRASGLMLDAVWAGRSFRAPARAVAVRSPNLSLERSARTTKRRPKESARPAQQQRKRRRARPGKAAN